MNWITNTDIFKGLWPYIAVSSELMWFFIMLPFELIAAKAREGATVPDIAPPLEVPPAPANDLEAEAVHVSEQFAALLERVMKSGVSDEFAVQALARAAASRGRAPAVVGAIGVAMAGGLAAAREVGTARQAEAECLAAAARAVEERRAAEAREAEAREALLREAEAREALREAGAREALREAAARAAEAARAADERRAAEAREAEARAAHEAAATAAAANEGTARAAPKWTPRRGQANVLRRVEGDPADENPARALVFHTTEGEVVVKKEEPAKHP